MVITHMLLVYRIGNFKFKIRNLKLHLHICLTSSIIAILELEMGMQGTSRARVKRWLMAVVAVAMLITPVAAHAVTLISQGYTADSDLPAGSIVSLKKDSTSDVERSTLANVGTIFGVVIGDGASQVSLQTSEKNQVQVATGGVEQVLVSDVNGSIAAGDQITTSVIEGVGMKATASTKVIGVAQDKFPNSTATDQEYTDKDKQKNKVKLGQVPVLINVAFYYKQPDKTIIPASVQNIANAFAGKPVDTLPILISVGIFIVTLIVVVSIIYAMIKSSIISVGRNPMAQAAVYRNVIQLSVLVVIILAASVVSIYMVLRKLG